MAPKTPQLRANREPGHRRASARLLGHRDLSAQPLFGLKPLDWRRAARWPAPQPFSAFSTGIKRERQGPRVGVRAGDLKTPRTARPVHGRGHHSLVTPIDWKRALDVVAYCPRIKVTTRW